MVQRFTVPDILSWLPAPEYTYGALRALVGTGKTPLELSQLPIPASTRLWLVLRPEILPESQLYQVACTWAEQVQFAWQAVYPGDRRPQNMIAARRDWIAGRINDTQLKETAAWANAAAHTAVRVSSRSPAAAAAWAASEAALWVAWPQAGTAATEVSQTASWAASSAAGWGQAGHRAFVASQENHLSIARQNLILV